MIRISITFFLELGAALKPIASLDGKTTLLNALSPLYAAKNSLVHLLNADWFLPAINASYSRGQILLEVIEQITARTDYQADLGFPQATELSTALNDFMGAVRAELSVAESYFVTVKGGYSTTGLISQPELFPADMGVKAPLAMADAREAAKCLAFELCTASGFHVLRATEAVLRSYWDAVTDGRGHPEQRNIGVYLRIMDDEKLGSEKVRSVLRQIKDLHRNPLMHPEDHLSLDEAIDLFGIARSAIGAMLKDIPQKLAVPVA